MEALVIHKSDCKRVYSCQSWCLSGGDTSACDEPLAVSDEQNTFHLKVQTLPEAVWSVTVPHGGDVFNKN